MKPYGHAGADGKCGQRNSALTTLPTAPWTSDVIKMFFALAHMPTGPAADFLAIANVKNERRLEGGAGKICRWIHADPPRPAHK